MQRFLPPGTKHEALAAKAPVSGFSLIELLVSMAIMALLVAMSVPAVSSLKNSSDLNKNLTIVAGILEEARLRAVSQNTYVWILFSENPSGAESGVKVATIASLDGRDVLGWVNAPVNISANGSSLETASKIREMQGVEVRDWSESFPTVADLQNVSPPPSDTKIMAPVSITGVAGRPDLKFTRAIQFTPTGEARINAAPARFIDFTVVPVTEGRNANQAMLRVSGLTGKATIFRNGQ